MGFTYDQLKAITRTYAEGGEYMPALEEVCQSPRQRSLLDLFKRDGFKVWTEGNSKLPFLSFSGLPGEGHCPGAGECLDFCYSFKGWRNFAPFLRQFQNSRLLDSIAGRRHIVSELDKQLARRKFKGREVDVRLYVDGDYRNKGEIKFWMNVLRERPSVRAYCYSKSLHLFKEMKEEGYDFPPNFKLNLSTGGVYDGLHDELSAASFVRGRFAAGPVHGSPLNITRDEKLTLTQWAKAEFGGKAVVCPGRCGDCTKIGHICGLDQFKGYTVVIPKH